MDQSKYDIRSGSLSEYFAGFLNISIVVPLAIVVFLASFLSTFFATQMAINDIRRAETIPEVMASISPTTHLNDPDWEIYDDLKVFAGKWTFLKATNVCESMGYELLNFNTKAQAEIFDSWIADTILWNATEKDFQLWTAGEVWAKGGSNKAMKYKWPTGGDLRRSIIYGYTSPYMECHNIKGGSVHDGKLDRKTFFTVYNIILDYDKNNIQAGNQTNPAAKACWIEARRNDITPTLKYSFACQRRLPAADYWRTKTIMKDQTDTLDCGSFFVQVADATWTIPGAAVCVINTTALLPMVVNKCEKQIANPADSQFIFPFRNFTNGDDRRCSINAGGWIETTQTENDTNSFPFVPNCINNYDKSALDVRYKCLKERPPGKYNLNLKGANIGYMDCGSLDKIKISKAKWSISTRPECDNDVRGNIQKYLDQEITNCQIKNKTCKQFANSRLELTATNYALPTNENCIKEEGVLDIDYECLITARIVDLNGGNFDCGDKFIEISSAVFESRTANPKCSDTVTSRMIKYCLEFDKNGRNCYFAATKMGVLLQFTESGLDACKNDVNMQLKFNYRCIDQLPGPTTAPTPPPSGDQNSAGVKFKVNPFIILSLIALYVTV